MSTPRPSTQRIHIVGAGLAGSEAAWFLAERGIQVTLYEMRPTQMTPAHQTSHFAELVCSNSFKSTHEISAPGMLKADLMKMKSLILNQAHRARVPAGEALAVDREVFSSAITESLRSHPNISIEQKEVIEPIPHEITLLATGPLTSEKLSQWIASSTGLDDLYFYDAIAPIIDASSIDRSCSFLANRYDKGDETAYLNCPMNEEEYSKFIEALLSAEKVQPKAFEKEKFYQGCQPIEVIAATGKESLRFGPMKPVGLTDPRTGQRPHAVVQLRPENKDRTAYNLVGFQTKLKYGEQSRVFRLIPALKNAEFLRLGSIHRNTYVCGPKVLNPDLSLRGNPLTYLAGQITGVEGYLESAACGLLAGLFIEQRLKRLPIKGPPVNTALGALLKHIIATDPKNYQPSGIHYGLFEHSYFDGVLGLKRDLAREKMSHQAKENFQRWWDHQNSNQITLT